MKDTIYTIPLTDAFNASDECPFCFIHRKLEEDAISFTLGASYMEDDIRALTDQLGFCSTHYKKLYEYGNRLGLALILQTHYQSLIKDIEKHASSSLPSANFLQKITKSKANLSSSPLSETLKTRSSSCYICNRVDENMERYCKTFFHLLNTSDEFKLLFQKSKGLCLPHFSMLIDLAPLYLTDDMKLFFFNESKRMLIENLARIEEDLSWFIDKYDYRNNAAPWKNAKDAIPRSIQKLASIYVQDPPFKESN